MAVVTKMGDEPVAFLSGGIGKHSRAHRRAIKKALAEAGFTRAMYLHNGKLRNLTE